MILNLVVPLPGASKSSCWTSEPPSQTLVGLRINQPQSWLALEHKRMTGLQLFRKSTCVIPSYLTHTLACTCTTTNCHVQMVHPPSARIYKLAQDVISGSGNNCHTLSTHPALCLWFYNHDNLSSNNSKVQNILQGRSLSTIKYWASNQLLSRCNLVLSPITATYEKANHFFQIQGLLSQRASNMYTALWKVDLADNEKGAQ